MTTPDLSSHVPFAPPLLEGPAVAAVVKPAIHIMVDLETMGSAPGSAIASIGAVAFDPVAGTLGREFYRNVSMVSCQEAGLKFDADTISWWLKQSEAAREALRDAQTTLRFALQLFTEFWKGADDGGAAGVAFWSHGANFDEPMLAWAYAACGIRRPWGYHASRCTRTIYDLAGVKPDRADGTHHNALDDAKAQARAVCAAYEKLGLAPLLLDARA